MPKKQAVRKNDSAGRQTAHLKRLAAGGGAPVRVDTQGEDLARLDALVRIGYAPSRAEAYRKAMRETHAALFE